MIRTLNILSDNERVTILRLRPRFGQKMKNLNDVTVNFDYQGKMICELQIKLCHGSMTFLYHGAHLCYEIERLCDSQDRYKFIEAYSTNLNYLAKHNMTIDSELKDKAKLSFDVHGV